MCHKILCLYEKKRDLNIKIDDWHSQEILNFKNRAQIDFCQAQYKQEHKKFPHEKLQANFVKCIY